jgi:small subunit ribosomal protein S11
MAAPKKTTVRRKKIVRKNVGLGVIHIHASFNNTMVSLADKAGDSIGWASAGAEGFTSSKKSTPFAAAQVTKLIIDKMKAVGVTQVEVVISGIGGGRDSALRMLGASGADILSITDKTPVPHNGCRPRKSRRV